MDELVALLWRRDEEALRLLELRYGALLRKLLSGFLRSGQDTEEAMNDVLMQIWRGIPPAKPDNFKAYLAKTARNTALHYLERNQAQKRGGTVLVLEELAECVPDPASGREVDRLHLKLVLDRFVRSLHGEQRSFFLRRYYYGERVAEIAAAHGTTEDRVSASLLRSRRKLRELLEKEECTL